MIGALAETTAKQSIGSRDSILIIALAAAAAVISGAVLPLGFQGRDDFHYLLAAEQWLSNGVSVGQDHWSNRLPYVLSIAAFRAVTGNWERALYLLHSTCFIVTAALMWLIARRTFSDRLVAWWGLAVFVATPLLFRYVSTFYPEPFEVMLSAITAWMVLSRTEVRSRVAWLLAAGVVGGLVLSVRQTALALPAVFAAIILLQGGEPFRVRMRDVLCLAAGYSVPVLAELVYYWIVTGNPLYRLTVDTRHVELVSADRLEGGVPPASTNVLFNWDLASRWRIPSTVESHWTISPIVRLFTSPGMLLTPWAAVVGGVFAWRLGSRAKQLVLLVLLTIGLQYLLNTFVLALPPNTRYFGLSLALLAVLAGVAFAKIPRQEIRIAAYILLFALPCLGIAILQPRPSVTVSLLGSVAREAPMPLHLSRQVAEMAALRLRDDSRFAQAVSTAPPRLGDTVAALAYERPGYFTERCLNGRPAFVDAMTVLPHSALWDAVEITGVSSRVPRKAEALLRREDVALYLLRRQC